MEIRGDALSACLLPAVVEAAGEHGRVLVVEDDSTVADVVTRYLRREGFEVRAVDNGRAAVEMVNNEMPDLVVLDIMLPDIDGLEVCRILRGRAPIPIIMLTAVGEESDRILGLDLGADDYISKPFSPRELTARTKAVLRRARGPLAHVESTLSEPLRAGSLEIDLASREVHKSGALVLLTAREYDLLAYLVRHPHRVFRRDELLDRVWGYSCGDTSTVTVHVRRLRSKIEDDAGAPSHIQTVWGVGYRFEP